MAALDARAIHELLLVYVARGCQQSSASGATTQLTSLAMSDAISTLLPRNLTLRNSSSGDNDSETAAPCVRQCAITHPGSLWKAPAQSGRTLRQRTRAPSDASDQLFAAIRTADQLYVQVRPIALV